MRVIVFVLDEEGIVCVEALLTFADGDEDTEDSASDIDGILALRCTC